MRLLAPLREDLDAWRKAQGKPDKDALVFPGHDGERWASDAYKSWSRKAPRGRRRDGQKKRSGSPGPFARAAIKAGAPDATPYTLRHSFCSLLLHEGRSVIYVARQLGHDAALTLAHVRARDRRARRRAPDRCRGRDPGGSCVTGVQRGSEPMRDTHAPRNDETPASARVLNRSRRPDSNRRPLHYE